MKKIKEHPPRVFSLCGKRFDTVEVLRDHTTNCKACQAIQDKEARQRLDEERKEQAAGRKCNEDMKVIPITEITEKICVDCGEKKEIEFEMCVDGVWEPLCKECKEVWNQQ